MNREVARWQRRFTVPVIVAAIATVPLLIADQGHPSKSAQSIISVADWIIWSVFVLELVVMLAVSPSRLQALRERPLELAIVLLTPPFLSIQLQQVRVVAVLRVLRLLRLGPVFRHITSLEGLGYVALVALVTLIVVGIAFFAMLTGAVAQRFLATQVEEAVVEVEEVVGEMESAEADILVQIAALSRQLGQLETTVRRRGRRHR